MTKYIKSQLLTLPKGRLVVGWQEWCSLDELVLPAIKAKIDTGAKTSALHAFDIQQFQHNGKTCVNFKVHPLQNNSNISIQCHATVLDLRNIMSSNGHKEERYVIQTNLALGKKIWRIELTLSNRDPLRFRMLLGREALKHRVLIEPNRVMCLGQLKLKELYKLYPN